MGEKNPDMSPQICTARAGFLWLKFGSCDRSLAASGLKTEQVLKHDKFQVVVTAISSCSSSWDAEDNLCHGQCSPEGDSGDFLVNEKPKIGFKACF